MVYRRRKRKIRRTIRETPSKSPVRCEFESRFDLGAKSDGEIRVEQDEVQKRIT
jgi:hypothetical protein